MTPAAPLASIAALALLALSAVPSGCGGAVQELQCRRDADCPGAAVCDATRCFDPGSLGSPALLAARRVVLWPEDDAVVARGSSSVALGPTDFLSVGGGQASSMAFRTYLSFDLRAIPSRAPVRRAEIRLRTRADPPGLSTAPCTFGVYLANRPWRSGRLTWQNQPGPSGDEMGWTVVPGATEGEVRVDVTALVADVVRGALPNNGFVLVARRESGPARVVAYSSRSPRREVRPRLEVLY